MPAAVACVKSLPDEPQSAHRCPHGSPSSLPKTGMGPSRPLQQTVRDSCSRAQDGTLRPGPCLPSAPRPHGAAPTFLPTASRGPFLCEDIPSPEVKRNPLSTVPQPSEWPPVTTPVTQKVLACSPVGPPRPPPGWRASLPAGPGLLSSF